MAMDQGVRLATPNPTVRDAQRASSDHSRRSAMRRFAGRSEGATVGGVDTTNSLALGGDRRLASTALQMATAHVNREGLPTWAHFQLPRVPVRQHLPSLCDSQPLIMEYCAMAHPAKRHVRISLAVVVIAFVAGFPTPQSLVVTSLDDNMSSWRMDDGC